MTKAGVVTNGAICNRTLELVIATVASLPKSIEINQTHNNMMISLAIDYSILAQGEVQY